MCKGQELINSEWSDLHDVPDIEVTDPFVLVDEAQ